MGKLKQMIIDNPMLDGELQRDPTVDRRVYIMNGHSLNKHDFIAKVLVDLYLNTNRKDLREQLDALLNDDNSVESIMSSGLLGELLCIGKNQYMSYIDNLGDPDGDEEYRGIITQTENIEETYPLKKFEVSYDVEVKPLTPDIFHRGRKRWKRVSEIVEATRFRDAKEIIQEKFKNDPKGLKIKSIDVSEIRG